MTRAEALLARARALVGTPFRPQGRSAALGLDCIGLVAVAAEAERVRCDYRLRGGDPAELEEGLRAAGFRAAGSPRAADVLVMRAGPQQLHLGIWTGAGLIHADAGLRRVVERPGPPLWPVLGAWRLEED